MAKLAEMVRRNPIEVFQREAVRILQEMFERVDITPLPDGAVRFTFEGDVRFHDRISLWGASVEDLELTDEDAEDDGTAEDCGRDLPKLASREELAEISEVASVALADLRAETGPLPGLSLRDPAAGLDPALAASLGLIVA